MYWCTSLLAKRAMPPCWCIEVLTCSFRLWAADVRYSSGPDWNHEPNRFACWRFCQSIPTSEKPPPWTSHVFKMLWMSEIFRTRTSLEDALLRLPPANQKMPSGLSCVIFPEWGTSQPAESIAALHLSMCSISELWLSPTSSLLLPSLLLL